MFAHIYATVILRVGVLMATDNSVVPENLENAVALVPGSGMGGIAPHGELICWGDNRYRQSDRPAEAYGVKSISLGLYHACAIDSLWRPFCWGDNSLGETDIPIDLNHVLSIDAGTRFLCGILTERSSAGAIDRSRSSMGQIPTADS